MNSQKTVGLELRRLGNLIRRKFAESSDVNLDNITPMHGWIVGYLIEHQETDVFQRDLEKAFSMRRSTVSRALQLMEKNGMITREAVDYDARLKRIELKEPAFKAYEARMKDIQLTEKELVKGIPKEELDIFYKVISKMKENLE